MEGSLTYDVLNRGCHKTDQVRLSLALELKLYNYPPKVDTTDKVHLYTLAIYGKRVYMKVLCEHLLKFGA